MMKMLDAVKLGAFKPLAVRGKQFPSKADRESVRVQFEKITGHSAQEAAKLFMGREAWENMDSYALFRDRVAWLTEGEFSSLDVPCNAVSAQQLSSDLESEDEASDYDSSSSDSGSTSAEEGMAAVEEDLIGKVNVGFNPHADVDRMYRHVRMKVLRFARSDDMRKTCCGRPVGNTFTIYKKDPDLAWPKCRICFGK